MSLAIRESPRTVVRDIFLSVVAVFIEVKKDIFYEKLMLRSVAGLPRNRRPESREIYSRRSGISFHEYPTATELSKLKLPHALINFHLNLQTFYTKAYKWNWQPRN